MAANPTDISSLGIDGRHGFCVFKTYYFAGVLKPANAGAKGGFGVFERYCFWFAPPSLTVASTRSENTGAGQGFAFTEDTVFTAHPRQLGGGPRQNKQFAAKKRMFG